MENEKNINFNEYSKKQKEQQKYTETVFQVLKDGMSKLKNEKDRVQFEYVGGTDIQSQEMFSNNNITNFRLYDKEGNLYFNDANMTLEKGFDKLLKYIAINNEKEGTDKIEFPKELQNYVDFAKNAVNKSKSQDDNLLEIEISDMLLDKEKFLLNKYDETYISINTYRENEWRESIDWNIRIKSNDRVINEFDVDNIGTEKISEIFSNYSAGNEYMEKNGNKLDKIFIMNSQKGKDEKTGAYIKEVEFNINGENYFYKYESETSNKKREISLKNSEGEMLYHVHTDPKKGYETYELGDKMNEKLWDNITYGFSANDNIVISKTFNRVQRLPMEFGNKERNDFKKELKTNLDKFHKENLENKNTAVEELANFELKKVYINQALTPKKYYKKESMNIVKIENNTYFLKEETSLKQNGKIYKEFSMTDPSRNDVELLNVKIEQDKENPEKTVINIGKNFLNGEIPKEGFVELDKFFKEKHNIDLTENLKVAEKEWIKERYDYSKIIDYDWKNLEGEELKEHKTRILKLNHYRAEDIVENQFAPLIFLTEKERYDLSLEESKKSLQKYGITAEDIKEFRTEMFYEDLIKNTSQTFKEMEETGKENISKIEANEKIEDIINETSKKYKEVDNNDKNEIIIDYKSKMETIFNIFTENVEGYKMINIEKFNNEFKDTFERMVNEDKEKINELKNIFKEEKVKSKEKDDFEK